MRSEAAMNGGLSPLHKIVRAQLCLQFIESHCASVCAVCVRTAVSDRRILGSSLAYYPPQARGQQGEGDPILEAGFSVTLPESNHPKKKLLVISDFSFSRETPAHCVLCED